MPRKPRTYTDGLFHFAAHGSDLRYLFSSDKDREDFLNLLAVVCLRYELAVLSYALMGTHYHTILVIPGEIVSQALQRLHTASTPAAAIVVTAAAPISSAPTRWPG